MGLTAAALPIIWVAAGGRKDITATLLATVFLTWLSQQLAVKGSQYALIWMGVILLVVVLFAPEGLFVYSLEQRCATGGDCNGSRPRARPSRFRSA